MKEIQLTQGKVAIVDDEDYEFLMQWKWYYHKRGYAVRNVWRGLKRVHIGMHNVILSTADGMEGDHINGNKLDNRKCNLRAVTHAQNMRNRGMHRHNTSGFKGATFDNQQNAWRAQIYSDNKHIHLGWFQTSQEAALAYNEAAKKYHGKYARLNEVKPMQ